MCLALHACALSMPVVPYACPGYWSGILSGCKQKDWAEPCTPHPFNQLAPWVLPWILKQTGCVLWLPTQSKGGWGSSKYPNYVNNQEDLAVHLIFCNFNSAQELGPPGGQSYPPPALIFSWVPSIALLRGTQPPIGSVSEMSPVTLTTNSHGGRGGISVPHPQVFQDSFPVPSLRQRQEVTWMGSQQVSDILDWDMLPGLSL